jgi:hypothetical protein
LSFIPKYAETFPTFLFFFLIQAVMMRSSQPHSGPNVKRCREDEKLLNSVLKPGMRGYIIDTRHQSTTPTPKVAYKIISLSFHLNILTIYSKV